MKVNNISYKKPEVFLLQDTGIGVPELAARTCYNSFENSENESIVEFDNVINKEPEELLLQNVINQVNDIGSSELLHSLSWVHHHTSIIEHTNLSFLIKGTSRGVLQEHARHRIQSISVRSTRYTMSSLINAFVAEITENNNSYPSDWFFNTVNKLDLFVTTDDDYNKLQIIDIFNKFLYQYNQNKEEFIKSAVAKSSLDYVTNIRNSETLYNTLEAGKKKRNVGDAFKHLVNDNWKVDMVVTFNLRSLKNYFTLRDSGAAFFQIRWLAEEMKKVTPEKYLKLIVKSN